ncbi:group 1 truncated hemoglobin [Paenibacillus sp. J22TS3]|uniref:group I truncated hemoglobin n=1 Tax=Paenibacillus sp. J22TS3 TaxID=2807192 RepID=UPI001B05CDCD|nr:group 1 truncated hemoglobin [Paenibacillus sp. J22TS3]GIP20606.1 group 1 truncated hemoglobin [Paenibacillus sp. J22TS3]
MSTLYEKFGGEESIAKVVDYFYDLVMADETVNKFFEHTDMKKQRTHQTKFISYALGGPNQYTGGAMSKVHTGMNLQPVHFDAIVKHLREALLHFGISEADAGQALEKVEALRGDIIYK